MPSPDSRTWFDDPDRNGNVIAVITDDLHVEINLLGTVAICGWGDSVLQLNLDDALDLVDVLGEAVRILHGRGRGRGHRTAYPLRSEELTSVEARSDASPLGGKDRDRSNAGDRQDGARPRSSLRSATTAMTVHNGIVSGEHPEENSEWEHGNANPRPPHKTA